MRVTIRNLPTPGSPEFTALEWAIANRGTELGLTVSEQAELEKALAAHPSHVRQRNASGRFVAFDWRRETPRGTGGRFIRRLTDDETREARALAETTRAQFERQIARHLDDLQKSRIDAEEATVRGREAIEEYYERIFRTGMQAAGNPAILLKPRDRAALARIVKDEGDYWAGFMADVAAGVGKMPYPERLACYVNASHEPFWLGWILGDFRPKRRIRWILGETDHCQTCLTMARLGWMDTKTFVETALTHGYLPRSGYLDCRGIRCQCALEDRK